MAAKTLFQTHYINFCKVELSKVMNCLNLGCGYHFHPSWTNVDIVSTGEGVIAHNLLQGIPFADKSFDVVYHSHVLEHISRAEAKKFLQECYRVLRPQGIIRVVVPDLEQIARLYLIALEQAASSSQEWIEHYEWILLEMYDQVVRNQPGGEMLAYLSQEYISNEEFVLKRIGIEGHNIITAIRQQRQQPQPPPPPLSERELMLKNLLGEEDYKNLQIGRFRQSGEVHQWMYDRYSLSVVLESVGFEQIKVCQPQESRIPQFHEYFLDIQPDGQVRKPDSLFVEAIKPVSGEAVAVSSGVPEDRVSNLQKLLHNSQAELERLQAELQQTITTLEESQSRVQAIESSKFWKMRMLWMRLKRAIGFKGAN